MRGSAAASAFAEIQIRITESTRQLLASLTALPAFRTETTTTRRKSSGRFLR
jgi:hypothetical protein